MSMIARQWRGLAHVGRAADYAAHLRDETFPALRAIDGFVDATLLRRDAPPGVEFVVVTRWRSLAAIERFAGADVEAAVVPDHVRAMMLEYDERVRRAVAARYDACFTTRLGYLPAAPDATQVPRIDAYYLRWPWAQAHCLSPAGRAYLGLRGVIRALRGTR